jgi:hypothetical protein
LLLPDDFILPEVFFPPLMFWRERAKEMFLFYFYSFCTQAATMERDYDEIYVGVLISLWLFLFHLRVVCSTTKRIFLGWVKEVRTTKS